MATKTISQLASAATLDGSELYETEQTSGGFQVSAKVYGRDIQKTPVDYIRMKINQDYASHVEGLLEWDNMDHTLQIHNEVSDVRIQVGQETVARVKNETGSTILNGQTVAYGGANGDGVPLGILARADDGRLINGIGVATHNIANGTVGYITKLGIVRDIDTSAFAKGDIVYSCPLSGGCLTNVRPVSPYRVVALGGVLISHATSGSIFIDPVIYPDQIQIISYTLPLTGVTDTQVPLAGTFVEVGASATANVTADWGPQGHHVYLRVNQCNTGGDITIQGDSVNEGTGIPSAADTEVITIYPSAARPAINHSTYYQTTKKWRAITNITLGGAISGANFNYGYLGYVDLSNRNFRILGYRLEAFSDGVAPDMRFIMKKVDGEHNKKVFHYHTIEDIGIDSDSSGDQIIDHIRTGADDRSYNSPLSSLWGNGELFVLKQTDFNTYWRTNAEVGHTHYNHEMKAADTNSGYIIRIEGEPAGGGISNVQFIALKIYYELMGPYEVAVLGPAI